MSSYTSGPAINFTDTIPELGPQFHQFINKLIVNIDAFFCNIDFLVYYNSLVLMCFTAFKMKVSLTRAIITFVRSRQSKQFTRGNLKYTFEYIDCTCFTYNVTFWRIEKAISPKIVSSFLSTNLLIRNWPFTLDSMT